MWAICRTLRSLLWNTYDPDKRNDSRSQMTHFRISQVLKWVFFYFAAKKNMGFSWIFRKARRKSTKNQAIRNHIYCCQFLFFWCCYVPQAIPFRFYQTIFICLVYIYCLYSNVWRTLFELKVWKSWAFVCKLIWVCFFLLLCVRLISIPRVLDTHNNVHLTRRTKTNSINSWTLWVLISRFVLFDVQISSWVEYQWHIHKITGNIWRLHEIRVELSFVMSRCHFHMRNMGTCT